jgi:DNA polymerase-1
MGEESGDKNLKEALRNNYDVHLATANGMNNLNLTTEDLTEKTEANAKAKKKYKKERDSCKCVVFGTAYGKSAFGFSKDFQCSLSEAQDFIDQFLNQYPGLRIAIEKTREQVYKYGYVRNMSGRRRRFPEFHKKGKWDKERCYRMAFNFKIQSFAADMVKAAAAKIVLNLRIKLINIVHDEIVCEVHNSYVEEACVYIKHCMATAIPMSLALETSMDVGDCYGACK